MIDLSELPDELQEPAIAPVDQDALYEQRLAELGLVIAKKRDEAVKARKDSGIEEVWLACEEAYEGIDDANRGEYEKARWSKSTSMSGPLTNRGGGQSNNKSSAFVRLTTRYVDMGAAKISEIVLPIDDKAFSFENTPVPEMVGPPGSTPPATPAATIMANPAAAAGVPAVPPATPPVDAIAQQAGDKAKKAETRIYDWMVESRYPMQMRKVIHDSARIGVGVLKGPFPEERKSKSYTVEGGKGVLEMVSKISPACKWIDAWNLFPHGACGEDIHQGDHILERDFLSASGLKALKTARGLKTPQYPDGEPLYIASQIDKVIEQGPDKRNVVEGRNPNQPENKDRFTVWYFTGTLNREDMLALGAPGADELPDEVSECYAIVTLVNDSPIRATFNPLEKSGHFGYRVFPWSRRAGHWAGVGVGEQVAMPQRMVNAGTRAWMNNAGKSAGAQIAMDQRAIVPADGNWEITPDKLWYLTGEAVADDIRKIFMSVEFPDRGQNLLAIINYAFKLAEEQSNIPLISQGQTGPQDPQTFGQAELQNTNANTLLRDKAYSLDDFVTEPLVDDFYEWLLLDPDVPEDEKGDFRINARGSSAMVEKAIQEQSLVQMLPLAVNPIWGQNPKKVFAAWLRSRRMNPADTAYTDAELAQMQSQPPPLAPAVQVAQINAQAKLHGIDMQGQQELQRVQAESAHEQQLLQSGGTTPHMAMATARIEAERIRAQSNENVQAARSASEQAYADTEAQIARDNAAARHQEIMDKRELAILEYSLKNNQTLEQVKASLAQTAMQEQTKRLLAGVDNALQQSEGHAQRTHDMQKHIVTTVANDQAMQRAEADATPQPVAAQ